MNSKGLIFLVLSLTIIPYSILSLNLKIYPTQVAVVSFGYPNTDLPDNKTGASCTNRDGIRSYIKYNLSGIDVNIEKAILWFYKKEKNNIAVLDLGLYHVENDNWNSFMTWKTQPCQSNWSQNLNCSLKPFYAENPDTTLNIWEGFDVTDMIRDEDDKVFSFVLKTFGTDKLCEIDQWIYYENNSFLEIEGCISNWIMNDSNCQSNDKKFVFYTDSNNCGIYYSLPHDNGTYVNCDYCLPDWREINTSCQPNDVKVGYFIDENDCYSKTGLENDLENKPNNNTYFCDYCLSEWVLNDTWSECQFGGVKFKNYYDINSCLGTELPPIQISGICNYTYNEHVNIQANQVYSLDLKDETNVSLEIMSNQNILNGIINITPYSDNPTNTTFSLLDLGNYVDISVNPEISGNLSWILIKIYYTDEDVNKTGAIEGDLRIYTFNDDTSKWEKLDDSGVNTILNYVWGNITHFSFYGIFEYKEYCGDGVCNGNETHQSCPDDCKEFIFLSSGGKDYENTSIITTTLTTTIPTSTTSYNTVTSTTTSTSIPTTTSTIEEGLGPTGQIVKTTGKFPLTVNPNIPILVGLVILLLLILIKFGSFKNITHLIEKIMYKK